MVHPSYARRGAMQGGEPCEVGSLPPREPRKEGALAGPDGVGDSSVSGCSQRAAPRRWHACRQMCGNSIAPDALVAMMHWWT